MWGRGKGRNLKPCSKCETLEQKRVEEKKHGERKRGEGEGKGFAWKNL